MKKRISRIVSVLLVLVLVTALLPTAAFAANSTRCGITAEWQQWTSTNSLPTSSGYYYLTNNVSSLSDAWRVNSGVSITVDLNGKDINLGTRTIFVNGTLNIHNSSNSGGNISSSTQHTCQCYGNVTFNDNVHIVCNAKDNAAVYISNPAGTVIMNGGDVSGDYGICIANRGTFIMNGGEIKQCSQNGILNNNGSGTFTFNGGRLSTSNTYDPALPTTSYTVTFDSNGGSGGTTSTSKSFNSATSAITPPARTGYTFNGYYDNSNVQYYNASGAQLFKWDKLNAQTLTAQWTANKYNVAFDPNGGADAPANVAATYDANSTIPTETPSNAGYFFKEWNTAQDGSGTGYASGATVKNLAATNGETVTLYAQWSTDDAHHGIVDLTAVTDDEATKDETENATSFDVLATAKTGAGADYADITYYVTIAWSVDTESININAGAVYQWSTTELKYAPVSDGDGALTPGGNAATTVTVTNRSNAAVTYTIAFDNATATTGLTTSEAKAEASTADVSGTLGSADLNGASSDATGSGHVYKINAANIDATGNEEQSAEYKGTVTVTEIADGTEIENNADLTLGTYTVTLGAPNTDSGETE